MTWRRTQRSLLPQCLTHLRGHLTHFRAQRSAKTHRHDARKGNRKRRLASATSRSHYRRAVAELSRYAKLLLGRSSMSDPLESRKDLVRYFEDGAKPPEK